MEPSRWLRRQASKMARLSQLVRPHRSGTIREDAERREEMSWGRKWGRKGFL